ncbi:MAG: ABC transporter permease subunit [Candidatus Cloacimonetes bacterium]|nr:ABC transporter permease subunit [Candidatus Cloacimonadota bacterium]
MKSIIRSSLSILLLLLILSAMLVSLKITPSGLLHTKLEIRIVISDILISFLRVTIIAIIAWLAAIFLGKLLHQLHWLKIMFLPAVNFIRHISPFAWLPFALIWFGLGETPAAFILFTALFFPAIIMTTEMFEQIPVEYIEEAHICGASNWQKYIFVELPLLKTEFINLFRVLWGLGWTTVIAVEMLGVKNGLGFRLLDFRYLLQYENMIVYLIIMGGVGILVDYLLLRVITYYKI